jgi:hypothetical protein
MDAVKVSNAATKAIAALADEPLSPNELHAALLCASVVVHQTIEANNKASIFARVLANLRGSK